MLDSSRVVVALSGGVDSSTVLALAQDSFKDVHAVTLVMQENPPVPTDKALSDAQTTCDQLRITHHIVDVREKFQQCVVKNFAKEYAQGFTPNPCVNCNRNLKIQALLEVASDIDAEFVMTGHYARIEKKDGVHRLFKGRDEVKDQSYFLYQIHPDLLARLRFPLGSMTKKRTRELALERSLVSADSPDSQDACFLQGENRSDLIERFYPKAFTPGPIVDKNNNELGFHKGIASVTVGQRKGLDLGGGPARYVLRLDAKNNAVVVGFKEELQANEVELKDIVFHNIDELFEHNLVAKFRSRMKPVSVTVKHFSEREKTLMLTVNDASGAVAPGQACVLYKDDLVVAGGTITCVNS